MLKLKSLVRMKITVTTETSTFSGTLRSSSNFLACFGCSDILRLFCLIVGGVKLQKGILFKFLSPGDKEVKEWKMGVGLGVNDANSQRTIVSKTSGHFTYKM